MVLPSQFNMDIAPTDITDGRPNLTKFWVRSLGFSKEFSHIKLLHQLSAAERLLAALLRGDRISADKILENERSPELFEQFANIVRRETLGCVVFERIVALDLASTMQKDDSAAVFSQIRQMSLTGAANHYQVEEKFARTLKITKEFHSSTLWVKGAHLSRTVYEPSYFRHFGDLDVIVRPSVIEGFVDSLIKEGFSSFHAPAYCNQIGVGPIDRPADIITAPVPGWIPSGPITMSRRKDGIFVDIKVGPFERGVQAIEFERLFSDAESASCLGHSYLGPSTPDHLLIMLCNFAKNRFKTWRTLLDIDLLVTSMNAKPELWQHFLHACKKESLSITAWVCLSISADRLSTVIPNSVLRTLAPKDRFFSPLLTFTLNPAYVWNSTSFPMMILNACASDDRKRKFELLTQSFFPSAKFLCDYYGNHEVSKLAYFRYLPMHWFVLLMPGGVVRRTLGRLWWSSEPKF